MKQGCPKIKRFENKEDGTLGLTEHVGFLKVSWKFLAKTNNKRVHERGTKAHLSCRKGYERVYDNYEYPPFVYAFRTPFRNPFVDPFVQK